MPEIVEYGAMGPGGLVYKASTIERDIRYICDKYSLKLVTRTAIYGEWEDV